MGVGAGVAVTTMMIVSGVGVSVGTSGTRMGVGVFAGTSGTRTGVGVFVGTSGTRTGAGVGVAVGPRQGQAGETRVGVGVGARLASMMLGGCPASRTQTGTWSDAPAASGATPMSNRTDSSATVIARGMVHGSISVFLLLLGA
jgi:hypothetical protein